MSEHDGHRRRLRERFLRDGLDGFADHEVLELLLFYANPRGDMNPVAHRLMERFGSLSAIADASMEELVQVSGIGENSAALLQLLPALFRRFEIDRTRSIDVLDTTEKAGRYFTPLFRGVREERVYVVTTDICGRILRCHNLGDGGIRSVGVSPRKIVELALMDKASAVFLAHNHTSGYAVPSRQDEETTHALEVILAGVDVRLTDHLIVAAEDFVSMADNGSIGSAKNAGIQSTRTL